MPRQSSKWIAALVSLLLIALPVVIGVLSNLLAGHRGFFDYFNDHPWSTLGLAIIGLTLAVVYLTAWQQRTTKEPATPQDLEVAKREILEAFYQTAVTRGTTPALDPQAKDAEIARLTQELEQATPATASRPLQRTRQG
jgi:ABC-type molybdate transport system permease subunit